MNIDLEKLIGLKLSPNQYCYLSYLAHNSNAKDPIWLLEDDVGVLIERGYLRVNPISGVISATNGALKLFDITTQLQMWFEF